MARRESRVAGGESAAYEKLNAGLRYAIEAATELGVLQQREQWTKVAMTLQQTQQLVTALQVGRNMRIN